MKIVKVKIVNYKSFKLSKLQKSKKTHLNYFKKKICIIIVHNTIQFSSILKATVFNNMPFQLQIVHYVSHLLHLVITKELFLIRNFY